MAPKLASVVLLATVVAPLRAQCAVDTLRMLDSAWARAYATHALALALFADPPASGSDP